MLKTKFLPLVMMFSGTFISSHAYAAITIDKHGNVGYDTAEECDAAVQSGTARFYESSTKNPPLLRKNELTVQQTNLAGLGAEYALGACDMGVGKSFNRDGVSKALQGKYVPYSPNMPVNVYFNKESLPVRASMQFCDNNFSSSAPRPVKASPAPVVIAEPVVVAPVVAPKSTLIPYVFGTVGAARDGISVNTGAVNTTTIDTVLAGQLGAGVQFNEFLGTEVFYQGGNKFNLKPLGTDIKLRDRIFGARATIGGNLTDSFRLFGKLGVTNIRHKTSDSLYSENATRPAAGLGMAVNLTDSLELRADYDHTFKKKKQGVSNFDDANYLGLGLQYNFNQFDM